MLAYALTLAGITGVILVSFLARSLHPSWSGRALLNLRRFLIPFAVTGVVFSGLQIWLALSDDFEATSRTIKDLETELARLRIVVTFLKPAPWLEAAIYLALLILLAWPAAVSSRRVTASLGRYLRYVSTGYVWLSLLTSLTFFGGLAASEGAPLSQRIATLDRHVDRIEQRYAKILETAPLAFGSEWLRNFALPADGSDDDEWSKVIAFATELSRHIQSLPPANPGLFDPPPDGAPPSPPETGPKSPAAAAAALALLEQPSDHSSLRPRRPLQRLSGSTAGQGRPLAERAPAPAPARLIVLSQAIVRELAGQFPEHAKGLTTQPAKVVASKLIKAALVTRDAWSEPKATEAEAELASSEKAAKSLGPSQTLFASIGARLAAAGYESQVDKVLDALKDPAQGMPLGIIAAFMEAVVNDTVKGGIVEGAERATQRWLRGTSLAEAIAGFRQDASSVVQRYSGLRLRERLTSLGRQLDALRSRWMLGQAGERDQLKRLAVQSAAERWSGFESVWNQACAGFAPALREPAAQSLAQMKEAFDKLDVPGQLARLEGLEAVWLESAFPDMAARLGVMLRSEAIMGIRGAAFEQAATEELLSDRLQALLGLPDIESLIAGVLGDVDVEEAQRREIAEAVRQKRAEALTRPHSAAAFIDASRSSSQTQARQRFLLQLRKSCELELEIRTYRVVNRIPMGPIATRQVTVPCF